MVVQTAVVMAEMTAARRAVARAAYWAVQLAELTVGLKAEPSVACSAY